MPWHVAKTVQCPVSRPWGVIKDSTGDAEGRCHATEKAAERQLAALYASESRSADDDDTEMLRIRVEEFLGRPTRVEE